MASAQEIICAVCGAKNKPSDDRCASCGARLERLSSVGLSPEEMYEARYQQHTFSWKWVWVSFGIYMAMQIVLLVILPMILSNYDPQGPRGLWLSAVVWFVGGTIVGAISPGKTFFEPMMGALIAAAPTIFYLMHISDVLTISLLNAMVSAMLGVMVTLFGAFLGEYIQNSKSGSKS